jgi:hypothetical protein
MLASTALHLATGSAAEVPHSLHVLVLYKILGQVIPEKLSQK